MHTKYKFLGKVDPVKVSPGALVPYVVYVQRLRLSLGFDSLQKMRSV